METEKRITLLFSATPDKLAAVDSILEGNAPTARTPSLRLFSMGEACAKLGVSRPTLWRLIRDKRISAVEVRRGSRRVAESELVRFVGGAA